MKTGYTILTIYTRVSSPPSNERQSCMHMRALSATDSEAEYDGVLGYQACPLQQVPVKNGSYRDEPSLATS